MFDPLRADELRRYASASTRVIHVLQKELYDRLHAELRANHESVASEVRTLDGQQLARRPVPGKWSVAQILEHLVLMDTLFLAAIEPMIPAARRDAGAPDRAYHESFIGNKIAAALTKPAPLKAPKAGIPVAPRAGVVEKFLADDARYLELIEAARLLDWNALRMRPPVAPWLPLRINLGDVFHIHAVHVTRHLAQIRSIKAAL